MATWFSVREEDGYVPFTTNIKLISFSEIATPLHALRANLDLVEILMTLNFWQDGAYVQDNYDIY